MSPLAVFGMLGPIAVAGSASGFFRSIQQVTITITSAQTSGTATITGVSAANTILIYGGITGSDTTPSIGISFCSTLLTNSTTITAEKAGATNPSVTVNLTVLEFADNAISNIQTGNIVIATAAGTATATITSVVMADSLCHFNGSIYTTTANANDQTSVFASLQLTSPTNIDCGRGSKASSSQLTTYYNVVRFKPGILNQSTQQMVVTTSANTAAATITSAALASTAIFYGHFLTSNASIGAIPMLKLDTPTALNARSGTGTGSLTTRIAGTVVNFKPGNIKSINRQYLTMTTAAASVSSVITSVVAAKTYVSHLGFVSNVAAATTAMGQFPIVSLLSPTTVLAQSNTKITGGAAPSTFTSFEAVEFT